MKRLWILLIACCWMGMLSTTWAQSQWSGAVDNDYFNAGNWSDGVPQDPEAIALVDGGSNLPVVLPASLETLEVGGIQLGVFDGPGHLVQNGGTIVIAADISGVESSVGDAAFDSASWTLNGNSTVLYDDPLGGNNAGFDTDGSGKDFDVGKSVPEESLGELIMHDNSLFRISDDLKIADGSDGHGALRMDGNAVMTVGSGISASGTAIIDVLGNALLVTGNSADPGDSVNGRTNEGYLTLSSGGSHVAEVTVADNGRIYARTLQQRAGISTINVSGNGQFHVFDVFNFAEPNLGVATVTGSSGGPQRTSHLSENADGETYITLSDNASMSIDSDLEDSEWSGLSISGGNNRGATAAAGGITVIEVRDSASFVIQQDLNMTNGVGDLAESTLKVRGPDATVNINGNLRMAMDGFGDPALGTATLHAVITGSSHSTIVVGESAMIENGNLVVEFDGYTPRGGETYDILSASQIEGGNFREVTLPALPDDRTWDVQVTDSLVRLMISGGLLGDFDGSGVLDAADIDQLTGIALAGSNDAAFDLTSDGLVNGEDRTVWISQLRNTYLGDANLDGEFNSSDFVAVFTDGKFETGQPATWGQGDWNGDGVFGTSDFVAAFSDGGFEIGPKGAVSAVPEPHSVIALPLAVLLTLGLLRRRR